jgi:hypothetical protein
MGIKIPNAIQPDEYSKGSVLGGFLRFFGSVWRNPNGNRNVPYLNWNDNERNLNLNYYDNHWNDKCRFAAVRKYSYSLSFFCERVIF